MPTDFIESFIGTGAILTKQDGQLLVGWGARAWTATPSQTAAANFYFPDFFLTDPTPWFTHQYHAEMTIDALIDALNRLEISPNTSPQPAVWQPPSQECFSELFVDLKEKIASNTLVKGVPYTFQAASGTISPYQRKLSLLGVLRYAQQNPTFPYGFWNAQQGILGATPELLFRTSASDSCLLETVACAGTGRNGASLIADPKLLHEHQLVVEGIRESLAPFGAVIAAPMQVLNLSRLSHLLTPLTLHMDRQVPFDTLVRAMHPTPALGAFPREPGMEWLKAHEQAVNRGRYGAPVGYITQGGEAASYVAIRNMQWTSDETKIGAGCGVVAQSTLEGEWQEILLKLQAIKELLGLPAGLTHLL